MTDTQVLHVFTQGAPLLNAAKVFEQGQQGLTTCVCVVQLYSVNHADSNCMHTWQTLEHTIQQACYEMHERTEWLTQVLAQPMLERCLLQALPWVTLLFPTAASALCGLLQAGWRHSTQVLALPQHATQEGRGCPVAVQPLCAVLGPHAPPPCRCPIHNPAHRVCQNGAAWQRVPQ